jgi:hypothetical protein
MGLPNHYACDLAFCKRHFTLINLCYAVVGKTPPVPADDDVDDIPF